MPIRTPSARRSSGFTLIELMIAVAVVALLAAIAIPSYQDSVWKGKRAEGKGAILKALQAEERFYSQNNTYVAYAYGSPPAGGSFPGFSGDSLGNSRYTIAVSAAPVTGLCQNNNITQCAIVTATVTGGTPDPKCGTTLSMDSIGNKTSAINDPICWR